MKTPTIGLPYRILRVDEDNANLYAQFLFKLRSQHWSLTSSAYEREPDEIARPDPVVLLRDESNSSRIGTFLLLRHDCIVGSLCLDFGEDGRTIVFSKAEADPRIQRRGVLAMCLARPCLLEALKLDVDALTMTTWAFNRKAFPLYAKAGFRIVPKSSVSLVSFFPMLFRQLASDFDGDPRRFVDANDPTDTSFTGLQKGREVCYSYAWPRFRLVRDVYVGERIRVMNPAVAADSVCLGGIR